VRPGKAIVLHRLDGTDSPTFRRLVFGDPVEGSNPVEAYARVDAADVPPFALEGEVVQRFEALVAHLREVTGK